MSGGEGGGHTYHSFKYYTCFCQTSSLSSIPCFPSWRCSSLLVQLAASPSTGCPAWLLRANPLTTPALPTCAAGASTDAYYHPKQVSNPFTVMLLAALLLCIFASSMLYGSHASCDCLPPWSGPCMPWPKAWVGLINGCMHGWTRLPTDGGPLSMQATQYLAPCASAPLPCCTVMTDTGVG